MTFQIETHQNNKAITKQFCSGNCFKDAGWSLEDADPSSIGVHTCAHCAKVFTTHTVEEKRHYVKLSDGTSLCFCSIGDMHDMIVDSEVGDTYTIEIIEMLPSALAEMDEFDGW